MRLREAGQRVYDAVTLKPHFSDPQRWRGPAREGAVRVMAKQRAQSRGLLWAVIGGAVLAAAIVLGVLAAVTSQGGTAQPTSSSPPPATAGPTSSTSSTGEVVDAAASEVGWVPEPITTDPASYLRAAIEAAGTVDTTRASRDEWVTYLDTWFTPDPRFQNPDEQAAQTTRYQQEMREAVIFPDQVWGSLARQNGRVIASAVGEISFTPVPDYDGDDMFIGTSDVVLTFTQTGEDGAESSYEEQVRVSAQVLCGEASVPTPGSAQAAGDCKLIRYFDAALSD